MDAGSHLKLLLQSQLASDASAVRYLPYCLSTLNAQSFRPSSHLTKWTTRIQSLIHSKEPSARWAGLCLAHKTAIVSQKMMTDSGQSWITVTMPLLSRNEPIPVLKAAIRLLCIIFTTATDMAEFQRQISVPNVVKFTTLVIAVADNHPDVELKTMCIDTLTKIIPLYPTTHRASSSTLSAFTLRYLNGSSLVPTNAKLMDAASRLYATIPLTGGKIGAVNQWRKSIDETLAFGWEAFYSLRTTFPALGHNVPRSVFTEDPQMAVSLNQDRLRCSVSALQCLLSAIIHRPVQIPLGSLIKFTSCLLSCSTNDLVDGFIDPSIRSIEVSVVPAIWQQGCHLLSSLAQQLPHRLEPYSARLLTMLTFQYNQNLEAEHRLYCLKAITSLLGNCYPTDSSILPTRLSKAILPTITKLLSSSIEASKDGEPSTSMGKKAKKRARNFEGDEVFKVTRHALYSASTDGEVVSSSLDIIHLLYQNPNLSASIRSIVARLVISLLLTLPKIPPLLLTEDPTLSRRLLDKLLKIGLTICAGTTGVVSKALPFVISAALASSNSEVQRDIGVLLHPRVPPLLRIMPHVESLSLLKSEESKEEADALQALGVADAHIHQMGEVRDQQDDAMEDNTSQTQILPPKRDNPSKQILLMKKRLLFQRAPPCKTSNTKKLRCPQSKGLMYSL